jgi:metallo-beta-lactamase class B
MKIILLLFLCIWIQHPALAQAGYAPIKVSKDIELIRLSGKAYIHVSYSELPGFGRFASNGLIYISEGQAFLFDTPVTDSLTKELTSWIIDSLKLKIGGFVPNHWHIDCIGGFNYLQHIGVESYANQKTIDICKVKGLPAPVHGFSDSLILNPGDQAMECFYPGAAHTTDNIVVWIPSEKILFAGCMVKEMNAEGMGNTADGDLKEWPYTLGKVLAKFRMAKIVIPGHGRFGGLELIKHTLDLLNK